MTMPVPAGHVRAFVERPADPALIEAGKRPVQAIHEIADIMGLYRDIEGTGSRSIELRRSANWTLMPAPFDDPHVFVIPDKLQEIPRQRIRKGAKRRCRALGTSTTKSDPLQPVVGGLLNHPAVQRAAAA